MSKVIRAYKLMRIKNKKLYPLFITRNEETMKGQWLDAEYHPTKGFAERFGWHCCFTPHAPHLKEVLASGEVRVWVEVLVDGYETYSRPESQGGSWILADKMKVIRIMKNKEDVR